MFFNYQQNESKCGIYVIWNRHKNCYYVGQTLRSFKDRWYDHKISLLNLNKDERGNTNINLKIDFIKTFEDLSSDGFLEFHILESFKNPTKINLNKREKYWIQQYKKQGYALYNFVSKTLC